MLSVITIILLTGLALVILAFILIQLFYEPCFGVVADDEDNPEYGHLLP